jgi:hypothetical protein
LVQDGDTFRHCFHFKGRDSGGSGLLSGGAPSPLVPAAGPATARADAAQLLGGLVE